MTKKQTMLPSERRMTKKQTKLQLKVQKDRHWLQSYANIECCMNNYYLHICIFIAGYSIHAIR